MSDKLIEIAKANGAEVNKNAVYRNMQFYSIGEHVSIGVEELRATIEQVCAPLVEALEYSIRTTAYFKNDGEGRKGLSTLKDAIDDYRTLIGDKE